LNLRRERVGILYLKKGFEYRAGLEFQREGFKANMRGVYHESGASRSLFIITDHIKK
jgi:hypothetical protein